MCVRVCKCVSVCKCVRSNHDKTSVSNNLNINTKTKPSRLPELGAVFQSRRQRWWLWRRQQHRGHFFLQLELSPSGITHG